MARKMTRCWSPDCWPQYAFRGAGSDPSMRAAEQGGSPESEGYSPILTRRRSRHSDLQLLLQPATASRC